MDSIAYRVLNCCRKLTLDEGLREKQIVAAEKVLSLLSPSQKIIENRMPQDLRWKSPDYTPSMIGASTILYYAKPRWIVNHPSSSLVKLCTLFSGPHCNEESQMCWTFQLWNLVTKDYSNFLHLVFYVTSSSCYHASTQGATVVDQSSRFEANLLLQFSKKSYSLNLIPCLFGLLSLNTLSTLFVRVQQ